MPTSSTPTESAELPARGWTPERQLVFLDRLAHHGTARAAADAVGLSVQTAYRLRRRDPLLARGWNAALLLARDTGAQVLAERAIDGIEERVYYRGQLIGTHRRFDTRLLLAHLGRLDKLTDEAGAGEDAGRFDQLLACIAGERAPDDLAVTADPLPPPLDELVEAAEEAAEEETFEEWRETEGDPETDLEGERHDAWRADLWKRRAQARDEAIALWDAWNARVEATVDALIGADETAATEPGPPGNPFPIASDEAPDFPPGQCNLRNPAAPGRAGVSPDPSARRTC